MRSLARHGILLSLVFAAAASASPSAGTLGLSAAAYTVSESGGSVLITVDRVGGSTGAVSVYYATVTGTATSSDYAPKAGRLYWDDGDSSPKTFSVPILDVDDFSGSKQFSVDIKDVYGGAGLATQAATVTINGNGGTGALQLSSSSFSVSQSLGSLSVVIDRTGGSAGAVSVFYSTAPGSATTSDFSMKAGRLSWANGDMSPKTFVVPISVAVPFTGTKQFTITIKDVYGAAALGTPTTATVTILGSRGATVSVPAAPAGLSAAAGNAQVSLTWSASSGATSYHVMRSMTSGGPYTQVGAPTSTSYTETALNNGTTYYHVVEAANAAGTSANSAQVSATPVAPNPPPTTGTWINVTPSNVDLTDNLDCGNYGTESVQADTANPGTLYTEFNCQGIWKSTDYGATWSGPINTGTNGATAGDCAGGITIAPSSTPGGAPALYESCIRGNGLGFWRSVDGGVTWTNYFVAPSGTSRQDYYPPVVDPYDQNHLLMAGHEMDYLVESIDGGQSWTNVSMAGGMLENGGTGAIFFINTGNVSTTRGTWLWMGQQSGGIYGTWRTANGGASWAQVDQNEHPHGLAQIYQPGNGVVYMTGAYSALGWGVLRSADYGQTWAHEGLNSNENVVFGTSLNVYSMFGYPIGIGGVNDAAFETGAQPGTGTWVAPGTPAGLTQGSAEISVVNDGTYNIFVGAMWNSGLWRYIEP